VRGRKSAGLPYPAVEQQTRESNSRRRVLVMVRQRKKGGTKRPGRP